MTLFKQIGSLDPDFIRPHRNVDRVFLHCSASSLPQHAHVEVIDEWHRKRGFDEIGYHYFIDFQGYVFHGRDLEKIPAAQKGHNTGSIAICLAGLYKTNFTLVQIDSLLRLCQSIDFAYRRIGKIITFHGHCEVSNKACPVFDYKHYLKLDESGILNGAKRNMIAEPLEIFNSGVEVVELQRRLNVWLHSKGKAGILVDGVFGGQTQEVVVDFQLEHNIPPTGIVDSLTQLQLPSTRG